MIVLARKKHPRDERYLRLLLILSLLRGTSILRDDPEWTGPMLDRDLGSSLGHSLLQAHFDNGLNPKSMDRMLYR